MKKALSLLLTLSLLLCALLTLPVSASGVKVQDGLVVSIITDKEVYGAQEEIQVRIEIENTNAYPVENISIQTLLPEGLNITVGQPDFDNLSLAAGATYLSDPIQVEGDPAVITTKPLDTTAPSTKPSVHSTLPPLSTAKPTTTTEAVTTTTTEAATTTTTEAPSTTTTTEVATTTTTKKTTTRVVVVGGSTTTQPSTTTTQSTITTTTTTTTTTATAASSTTGSTTAGATTKPTAGSQPENTPDTGDVTNLILWSVLLIASAIGFVVILRSKMTAKVLSLFLCVALLLTAVLNVIPVATFATDGDTASFTVSKTVIVEGQPFEIQVEVCYGKQAEEGVFTYTQEGDGVTITGYRGEATELAIPHTLDGYPVTAIGAGAFYDRDDLVSVTVPLGVTRIGYGAFEHCDNLETVYLSNSVYFIGYDTFRSCDSLTLYCPCYNSYTTEYAAYYGISYVVVHEWAGDTCRACGTLMEEPDSTTDTDRPITTTGQPTEPTTPSTSKAPSTTYATTTSILTSRKTTATTTNINPDEQADLKVGFLFLHDENSAYDKNFIAAAVEVCEAMGVEMVQKTQVPESSECYDAAVELIEEEGCDVIFADSFGHEAFLMKAAERYPEVEFCHATGTMAHTAGLDNFHNAYAAIYEGRYLTGVVAGLKLKEMMESNATIVPKMGYVAPYTFAEVISSYTAFYLGAKSIVPEVTMDVKFTGSWYDETKELQAAQALIDGGCVLISQYADSMGAPTACEAAGVPNVPGNLSTAAACPETYLVSSYINWAPYFEHMIMQALAGEEIATDWTGTIETGSVLLTDLGKNVAAGTAEKLADVKAKLLNGSLQVFDTAHWTVDGLRLLSYLADVDTDINFVKDTNVIVDGIFYESTYRSAPYFDLLVDGITLLNYQY